MVLGQNTKLYKGEGGNTVKCACSIHILVDDASHESLNESDLPVEPMRCLAPSLRFSVVRFNVMRFNYVRRSRPVDNPQRATGALFGPMTNQTTLQEHFMTSSKCKGP